MNSPIVQSSEPILLVGGGEVSHDDLSAGLDRCGMVIAADSGADFAVKHDVMPDAVIGDMDSITPDTHAAVGPDRLHPIAEQDSTDFDKCLRSVVAPVLVGIGFTGARMDHQMAVQNALVRHPTQRCVLIGAHDVLFLCPPLLKLEVPAGTRLSLFPMGAVEGHSEGLQWPLRGLSFAPDGVIGTSNRVTGPVTLNMTAPKMLVILPRNCLDQVIRALQEQPDSWSAL